MAIFTVFVSLGFVTGLSSNCYKIVKELLKNCRRNVEKLPRNTNWLEVVKDFSRNCKRNFKELSKNYETMSKNGQIIRHQKDTNTVNILY